MYHIFNRGSAKRDIFHNREDYQRFIEILSRYARDHELHVYHWALMPNHYHLLVELNCPERLSSIMAGIGRSYVHYHHRVHESVGHLWQGRFKSQPIEKGRYLLSCGRYIERNPVKASIVNFAEDYFYSSAAYYVFGRPDGLTQEDPLFRSFGELPDQRREGYTEFMRDFSREEDLLFENLEFPRGSDEFLCRLIRKRGLYLPRRTGRPRS
jgi:putative transposase